MLPCLGILKVCRERKLGGFNVNDCEWSLSDYNDLARFGYLGGHQIMACFRSRTCMVDCGFRFLPRRYSDIAANTQEWPSSVSRTSILGNETGDRRLVEWDYRSIPSLVSGNDRGFVVYRT